VFTQGNLNVNPDLKIITPGFTSQRGRANSKSGGEFAMISVAPPLAGKENWAEEESDSSFMG